ncbi:MAG: hypothetical protein GY796_07440, partial [Chloroflexi bacterium]|nr:hypothetical protein [Chloroflexota bacterium]
MVRNFTDAAVDTAVINEVIPVGVIPIGHPAPDKRPPSLKRGHKPLTT